MKVIQVGLGDFGWIWMHDIVLQHSDAELVGVVDRDEAKLKRAREASGMPEGAFHTDLESALATVRPNFILNVTPPHVHAAIVLQALREKIPVLCEKPIADNSEAAEVLYAEAVASGVPVMIAENYRFSAVCRKVILSSRCCSMWRFIILTCCVT